MDNVNVQNAGFVLSAVFDRKKELMDMDLCSGAAIDPFYLLKEVAEMSNFRNQEQTNLTDDQYNMQQESLAGYNSLVMKNFDDNFKSGLGGARNNLNGYDPQSLAEKMAKLKFAKQPATTLAKDQDWFSKLNTNMEDADKSNQKKLRSGLTQEEELKIQQDMIPQYIARQQELKPEYEHIKSVGRELKQLKEEYGVVIRQAASKATTSFMNRRGSQARQYDLITSQIRTNRIQKMQQRQLSQIQNPSNISSAVPLKACDSRSQSRPRSLINETPLGAAVANGADKNGGCLQSLSEASREHTYRESPKNKKKLKPIKLLCQLRKNKSKTNMRKSSTGNIINEKTHQSQQEEKTQNNDVSSYHKSEEANICSKCGYYGCKGDKCEQHIRDQQRMTKGTCSKAASFREVHTAQDRKSGLESLKSSKGNKHIDTHERLRQQTNKGDESLVEDASKVLMTEGGLTFKTNANGLFDIRQTEKLFKNQKLKPSKMIKRDSDMNKSINETRHSIDSKKPSKKIKGSAPNQDLIDNMLSPKVEKKRISKSSYLNNRKAAQAVNKEANKDKPKKTITTQTSNLPFVAPAVKPGQQSLLKKQNLGHYTSGQMINFQIEKHNGTLNSKFKQLSSQVIMNFNEGSGGIANMVQPKQIANYGASKGPSVSVGRPKRKHHAIQHVNTTNDRGLKKKQLYKTSQSSFKQDVDKVPNIEQPLNKTVGGILNSGIPSSCRPSSMAFNTKVQNSILNVHKLFAKSSNNCQMEGGCNTQRASRTNIAENIDLKRIIDDKIIEQFDSNSNKSKKNSQDPVSRDQQVAATTDVSKHNSHDPLKQYNRQRSVGASYQFNNISQFGQMSMGNIANKGHGLFLDQFVFKNKEDKINKWHINNQVIVKNQEIEVSQDIFNRERMSKTIQNKTFEHKFNIDSRLKIQKHDMKNYNSSKLTEEIAPSKADKDGSHLNKKAINFMTNTKNTKAKTKIIDFKDIYQEVQLVTNKRSTLSPIKSKSKPKDKIENLTAERNNQSFYSNRVRKSITHTTLMQPSKSENKQIFSGRKRLNKTERLAISKEIKKQLSNFKKAEEIIYPQTIFCTSDNNENRIKLGRRESLFKKQKQALGQSIYLPIMDNSFEGQEEILNQTQKNNQAFSNSISPQSVFKIDTVKLKERLNACQDMIDKKSGKNNLSAQNDENVFSFKSLKSPNEFRQSPLLLVSKSRRANPYTSRFMIKTSDRYNRKSAYDSSILRDNIISPMEGQKKRPITFNRTIGSNRMRETFSKGGSRLFKDNDLLSGTSECFSPTQGNTRYKRELTEDEKKLVDLSKIRKKVLQQKPDLQRITSSLHHSKFKVDSLTSSMVNNINNSTDSNRIMFIDPERQGTVENEKEQNKISMALQFQTRQEKIIEQQEDILREALNKSTQSLSDKSVKQSQNQQQEAGEHSLHEQLEIEADNQLEKINNLLKRKVKEKKYKEKQLQDCIIHDKIAQLTKNNKLSKKEKNQLVFLKKLESRLVSKQEDLKEAHSSRCSKLVSADLNGVRVHNSNSSLGQKVTAQVTGGKIAFHNLIFNDLKFQSELLNILKKPKSTEKKDRLILSNLNQQKKLYGDEQTKKELSGKQYGRNVSATVCSQQFKSKSVSSRKERMVNNVKDILLYKKKTLRQNMENALNIQSPSVYTKDILSNLVSATMSTPQPIDSLGIGCLLTQCPFQHKKQVDQTPQMIVQQNQFSHSNSNNEV